MSETVVVVTGASSGIGAALSEELGRRGRLVGLVARREAPLRAVAARCGPGAHVIPADVTDRLQVRRAVADAIGRFGRIDVWVNNAGRGIYRMPSALTADDIDEMMNINVKAALYGMQEVLPHFTSRGTGHIVNISSILGRMPLRAYRSAYNGAKHFLNALTANFRMELQETHPGIQVTLVSPMVVYTDFGKNALHGGPDSSRIPGGQRPEEVARVIADVIASRRADVYTQAGARDRVLEYLGGLGTDP